jgi:flagellar protein FliL
MPEETQEKAATPEAKPAAPEARSAAPEAKAAATDAKAAATDAKPGAARKAGPVLRPQQLMLVGAVVVAVAAGVGGGVLVLGPRLASLRGGAPAAHAEGGEQEKGKEKEKEKGKSRGKDTEKAVVFKIDNLIVNPAGSGGTRFLMASVAVEVPDAKTEAQLRERDFQVRDAVIAVLEKQTLESITAPGGRDSVKARLAATLAPMVGRGVPVHVYLPQFVIQ